MTTSDISRTILIFKTNIGMNNDLARITPVLDLEPRINRWNIDQEDVDNVLRIESLHMPSEEIIQLIQQKGYHCEELPD